VLALVQSSQLLVTEGEHEGGVCRLLPKEDERTDLFWKDRIEKEGAGAGGLGVSQDKTSSRRGEVK